MDGRNSVRCVGIGIALVAWVPWAAAQSRPDSAAVLAAQRDAMRALASMDGVWRGESRIVLPGGHVRVGVQTERMGPMLGGALKVIEGRGYDDKGEVLFNAFAVVSYDAAAKTYTIRSYAQGHAGDFKFEPTADGFAWELPAGPATIRYVATIKDGKLHEVGDRIVPNAPPQRFFEMKLERIGDTDWPADGAITSR